MRGLWLSREGRGPLRVSGPEMGTEAPQETGPGPWREALCPPQPDSSKGSSLPSPPPVNGLTGRRGSSSASRRGSR